MRTSQTHPLNIDSFPLASGHVGMTLCPGRKGSSLSGPAWDRDLASDLARVKRWGADIVISLTETREMAELGVANLGEAVQAAGIRWLHLPIRDTEAPGPGWHDAWRRVAPTVHQTLEAGGKIVIHCRAGLERTALVGTLIQCDRGEHLTDALAVVQKTRRGARLLRPQQKYLNNLFELRNQSPDCAETLNLWRACLFGGAIGDALGAEMEFWSLNRIRARFPNGVDRILPHDGVPAAITDDTQMTLFTAEGLIRARIRSIEKGLCHPPSVVHHALLRWLVTQGEEPQVEDLDRKVGLIADPRLHRRRAPGNTCLSALRQARHFGDMARNDSKGCGSVMRMAPLGLFWPAVGGGADMADDLTRLTHGHQTGRDAARMFAVLVMVKRQDWTFSAMKRGLEPFHVDDATTRAIKASLEAPADGRPETVESLGGGWVAEEALAIALYAARVAESFEHGLRIAVTHSGDSDSTGAIAGNLLGLRFPDEVMAHPWRRQIECADLINRTASDLFAASRPDDGFTDRMWDFYPGW